jgi:hypothetical protein
MPSVVRVLRLFLLSVWAVVMTALTYVLGAPALKVVRRRGGRLSYWMLTTVITLMLFAAKAKLLAVTFFSLSALIGVFEEFEEMGLGFSVSAFFTLLINSLVAGGAFALWVFYTGPRWSQSVSDLLAALLKPVAELNPHLQISYQDLMQQLPSVALIAWIVAIYLAVLLEGRLLTPMERAAVPSLRPQLATLRLPDICVWIFIAALLGAFGDFEVKGLTALSINVLNICIVLFFFQGIAVVARFFESLRLATIWQVLFMFVAVVQLFLFVSLLGLLDFWLGFRARMEKRTEEEFNRET